MMGFMWNQQQPGPVPPSTTDPNQAPGQSRGLLALVREYLGGWLGPRLAPESRAGVEIASEKVHSGPAQVILPWFLPYFDDYTAEPAAARAAYRRMFADPNVKSALLGKLLAVAALDLKVRPADKKDPQDLQIAEFVKWTLVERVRDGFPGLIWSVLSGGLIDGYSVCEKVFEQEEGGEWDGQWPLVAVKPKDVGNDLVLQTDSYRNVVGVMGLRYNAGQEFSPARFLLWRHLPLYDTPTGMSDLRAVYSRYWLLDTVLKLRGVNAEKRAIPFLMGTYTNPTQQRSLENTLAQVKSQAWVTVPEGVRVEALNIAGSADSVFEGFIRDLKHDIFMGIQGAILQALEGSVSDGRGNSQVHRSTADLLVWYIAQTMQSLLNDRTCGLIKDIVDLNFVVQRYPRASLSAVDVGEMTAELDIDTKLFGMGIELSKEDMYERYNRVPPLNEADALKKDAGGGGMPGMPGSPPGGGGLPPGGDDPAGGGDDGDIDPPEGGDYDPTEDDDGLFDEPNLFTAPMRNFAEGDWQEEEGPRGGKRWRHSSGRVVYGRSNPGAGKSPRGGSSKGSHPQKTMTAKKAPDRSEVMSAIKQVKADGPTADSVKAIADALTGMTRSDIAGIKKELGLLAGGSKRAMAEKVATQATARITERQEWAREARKAGVRPRDLFKANTQMRRSQSEYIHDVQDMIRQAKNSYASEFGTRLTRGHRAFRGGDPASIRGFERIARTMAERFPGLLGNHGYEGDGESDQAARKLYDYMLAGSPRMPSMRQTLAQAFDHVSLSGSVPRSRTIDDDSVPFSEESGKASLLALLLAMLDAQESGDHKLASTLAAMAHEPSDEDDGLGDPSDEATQEAIRRVGEYAEQTYQSFAEWEEDKHPRGEGGKFGSGSGKAKGGSSEVKKQFKAARREARAERPAEAKVARQQVKERRAKVEAAKKAIVEHAENSFDLEQELGQLAFKGPAVNRVLDRLSLTYPDEKTVRGREVPKGSVDRLDDFRALAQAASNAQASYKKPKSGDEAEDYDKVQALMGKVKDYADQGVSMYRDAVKVKRGGKDRPASSQQPAAKAPAPASKPAEPAPWERNLAALASKYDVDYGDLDNLASTLPGEIASSKGHAKKALEKKLGAVKGIIRDRDAMRRQGGESFAESDWTQQKGERGGTKWVNRNTGREVYGKSNPGSGSQQKKKSRRIEAARVSQPGGGSIDHTSGPAPRQSVLGAAGGRVAGLIRQAKHSVDHVEHAVSDYLSHGVDRQIERLPGGIRRGVAATWWAAKLGTRAAFITYTTGQKLAEEVAKESGATPEQTARLKGVCTALDLVGAKAVPLVLGSMGLGAAALPGSFVPAGSAAYLAYSTARRPLAVLRAANRLIRSLASPAVAHAEDATDLYRLLDGLSGEQGDWYMALVCAALNTADSLADALDLADEAMQSGGGEDDSEAFAEEDQPDEDTIKLALVYLAAELAKGTITEEEYDEAISNLLNGPEEFAEEDWSQQATKTGGVKWINKTSGRVVYGKENPGKSKRKAKEEGGKPVEKATKDKPKAKGKEEDTATKEKKPAAKGKAAGPVGLAQARKLLDGATDLGDLAGKLAGLHNSDLQALKKELKVTAGGVKAEQAKAAAKAALAAAKGAGPAKPDKPTKPEPKKPEPGKGKVADEAQTWGSFLDAVGEREKAGGLLKIPELFDSLKKTSPDLTQEQFHDLLKKWQAEDKLVLQVANDPHFEPRAGEGIKDADGYTRLYVELGPAAEKELGQRKQSKPAPADKAAGGKGPEKPAGQKQGPRPPEPGFTGTDSLGRRWENGKLVAAKEDQAKPRSAAKPAPAPATPKPSPAPVDDAGGLDLGGGSKAVAMPRAKAIDLLRKSAQQGDDSRHKGYVDNSTAQKFMSAYDRWQDDGQLPPVNEFDYLGGGKIARNQFPSDESFNAAQEIAAEMFAAYTDADIQQAFGNGKNPAGTFRTRYGGPLVFPARLEATSPAYAGFLRKRLGAISDGEADQAKNKSEPDGKDEPPPPPPPASPPPAGGKGPEKGGAPQALSFLKPPEGAPSAEAIQAHADAHKALARLKENKADSWSPYTPLLDRKIKQQKAALDDIQKKNPGLKSDEPGFSGIDALGRRWQDGKLVPREETRKAFDAIGQLGKPIVSWHKDDEVRRNPQVFHDLARQGLMKRSDTGGYELTSEGTRALVEAYNDDPAGPTTYSGMRAYVAAYGSLPIEERKKMAEQLGVPPNESHPDTSPFMSDFERSLRDSTAERINGPIGPRLEKMKEQAKADIQALASIGRSAETYEGVADVLRKRVKDPARVSVRHASDVVPRSQKAMDLGASLLQGVIGRTSASLEGIESYQAVKLDGKLNMRAHAIREEKKINAPPGIDSPIAIHEIAHYLEDDPEILAASQAFLRHRTKGEKEVYLKELFPEYEYGPIEKGRKDNFDKVFGKRAGYYVGKAYGETSTEILSMGLEHLFRDPANFAAKDPEYTAFLLGVLDGSIRGKPIPKE